MNQAAIDLQQLRIKHILFKSKIRSVAYGGSYDADFFSVNNPVNIWFHTVGLVKYPQVPEMRELLLCQQELNAAAQGLYRLYQSGKIEEAHQGLADIDHLAARFTDLLTQLEGRLSA